MTRAAERLGIQQPPLSQQIKTLEAELEVQLFRRKPRGMELTEAGRALLEDARAVLAHVEHARATTRRTARGEQGRVVVGLTSSASIHPFVSRVIRAFRDASPMVSLALEEGGTVELVEALKDGRIDVAFVRSSFGAADGVSAMPLLDEEMVAALPTGHALAAKPGAAVPLASLATESFILYRRPVGPGLYDAIIAACHGAGFSPQIGAEAPRITSTLGLVAAGIGVSIVPESMQRLQLDGVAYRRLKESARLRAPLKLAHRRGEASAAVRRFVELVLRTAKGEASRPVPAGRRAAS